MNDLIHIDGQSYVRATSTLAGNRTLTLKHDESFAVFDQHGNVYPVGLGEQGLFHNGTRFLSGMVLTLNGHSPRLLSSGVLRDNASIAVDLTNPYLESSGGPGILQDTLHLRRETFLLDGVCYERLTLTNFGTSSVALRLTMAFEADFADIFEVRGQHRPRRGDLHTPTIDDDSITITYTGLDGTDRVTRIGSNPSATRVAESEFEFDITLATHQEQTIELSITCGTPDLPRRITYDQALETLTRQIAARRQGSAAITSSNEDFNAWINQSLEDLRMLTTETPVGPYPYAGTPWYSTAFGRDGIITAMQMLWVDPDIAKGVLRYLAQTQATALDTFSDAEPGKILHETRSGEMVALAEIPFGMYYGSVDATPLFIVLAGQYFDATGDRDVIQQIWPNIEAALEWVETYGDLDGDGFIEYQRKHDTGLLNQGWKDSVDSVFHADGTQAEAPIAICEMQAYVYAARVAAADLADMLGHAERATTLREQAGTLQEQFEVRFWDEQLGTYVLALDGDKQPCRVQSSNAGHVLFSGIASPEHAQRVAHTLLSAESFSGWGVRTIATGAARYNPMSYHNGSVWPHDNALIAAGLAHYGLQHMAATIMSGIFDTSMFMERQRLPELFCGFARRAGEGPTLYPVACAPQAWAAGAVFMLLQACLGMSVNGREECLTFDNACLPEYLDNLTISNLKVGTSSLDIALQRGPNGVSVNVLHNSGTARVVVNT